MQAVGVLHEDVFKPLGGLRSPVRATLGTFAVSAVLHEFIFWIAVGLYVINAGLVMVIRQTTVPIVATRPAAAE